MATFQQNHYEEKTGFLNVKGPSLGLAETVLCLILPAFQKGGRGTLQRVKKTS